MASLFGSLFGGEQRQREALIDLVLMAAMADGQISQSDLDRIARAIEQLEILKGIDWDFVQGRVPTIEADAPLFSETRARIAKRLTKREFQERGLELAAQMLGEPLQEEEKALLRSLAEGFDLDPGSTEDLIAPWRAVDPLQSGYLRCTFNDPAAPKRSFFQAIADAKDDLELSMLTFKLAAARSAATQLSETTEIVSVGEMIDIGDEAFRVDALLRVGDRSYLARFLAEGEAMYPREHELLAQVLDRMDSSAAIYIGFAGALAPPDEGGLQVLNPDRLRIERVEI